MLITWKVGVSCMMLKFRVAAALATPERESVLKHCGDWRAVTLRPTAV